MANSKKRRKLVVFGLIIGVLLVLGLLTAFKKRDPMITVTTEKVTRRNLIELVTANGKIQPVLQVKISPEVSGEITELPFKEGMPVKKGDLIVKIKPDFYMAARNRADASYKSALAQKAIAEANLAKAKAEFKRNEDLFNNKLISESVFVEMQTAYDVAKEEVTSATHQIEMAKAQLASAEEDLGKTTIVSPLTGTVSKLNSQVGERVVGTATMAGTEVMTVADLNEMEARVDIGEMDVIIIQPGQRTRLEVDAFKDCKFSGIVTEIANSSKNNNLNQLGGGGGGQNQEATKFEVKIRITEKENFRPGMSVSAEIETRYRTNALTVPYAAITTRPGGKGDTNAVALATNTPANTAASGGGNESDPEKKMKDAPKPVEVVFVVEGDHVKKVPVKKGIADANYWEVTDGLSDGQEIVSGGYKAVNRELEENKKIRKGGAEKPDEKKKG